MRKLSKHSTIRLLALTLLVFQCFIPHAPLYAQSNVPYSIRVYYHRAILEFTDAVGKAALNVQNRDAILQWADDTADRLPEFLDDMITASFEISRQKFPNYSIQPIEDFANKWEQIILSCPDITLVEPLFQSFIDNLLLGLPQIRKAKAGDTPWQNLAEHIQELENLNPWGLSAFFHFDPLDPQRYSLSLTEKRIETVHQGVRAIFIKEREVMQRINFRLQFFERIVNDKVVKVFYAPHFATLMHEVLAMLKRDNVSGDPLQLMQYTVNKIDENLQIAFQNGQIDDFTYAFLFDQTPIQNEIIHTLHPLLKAPYHKENFKVAELYPRK